MATTETTYELWYEVRIRAQSNGYHFDNLEREGNNGNTGAAPTVANKHKPVTSVSWRDVIVWTNALSEMMGVDPVYRTSVGVIIKDSRDSNASQVDGAILIGGRYWTPGNYASGATADTYKERATRSVAWCEGATKGTFTRSVGRLRVNHLGLYDMGGNVAEWMFDWHSSYIGSRRVIVPGGYNDSARSMQVGNVDGLDPGYVRFNLGLRLICGQ
jgi:formylglycine-generating enzyme